MIDLVAMLNTLVDTKGKILIPGIYDTVAELTPAERALYDDIDFSCVRFSFISGRTIMDPSLCFKIAIIHTPGPKVCAASINKV